MMMMLLQRWILLLIPSDATRDHFFLLVQKYSIWSVSCRNIQNYGVLCKNIGQVSLRVTRPSRLTIWIWPMPLINFRLCALFWGSCRNITILRYCISGFLCRVFFREYGIGGDTANLVFIASSAISWGAEGMRNKAGSISLEKEGKIYIMQGFLLSNGTPCSLNLSKELFFVVSSKQLKFQNARLPCP